VGSNRRQTQFRGLIVYIFLQIVYGLIDNLTVEFKKIKPMAYQLNPRITNREFKLLLKPEGLDQRSQINRLIHLINAFCETSKVDLLPIDNAATSLRNVYFYDSKGHDLRRHKVILRIRESRRTIWVDDWCEVTLKCRADNFDHAISLDPAPKSVYHVKLRFKEELLRADSIGSVRKIYSNNAILDSVPSDEVFERNFGAIIETFPGLAGLKIPLKMPMPVVGGRSNKILEALLPMGNLVFGEGVQAHLDVSIWMRSVGEPIIGELAYAYRVTDANRDNVKAHKLADKFFVSLQQAIPKWLSDGSTKTALIFGKPE